MDLVVRNARLRNKANKLVDIGIENGVITAISEKVVEKGTREIDASSSLVAPFFIDAHSHLDLALMAYVAPPAVVGGYEEGIARLSAVRKASSVSDVMNRATKVLKWAISNGTGAIRVQASIDSNWELTGVKAILELKKKYANLVNLQIAVLPDQWPLDAQLEEMMRKAMEMGADAVGGIPHQERTPEDVKNYIDTVFKIAKEYNKDIDMHVDELLDPTSRALEYTASKTITENWQGRVTAAHCCALATYNEFHAGRVIDLMKRARVNYVSNPKEELIVKGLGPSRIKEMMASEINISIGHNDIVDVFSPYGRMDMLEVAWLFAHLGQFDRPDYAESIFDMITDNPAKIMHLDGYGIEIGMKANFNVIDAQNAFEAIRTNADRLYVVRGGKVLCETKTVTNFTSDVIN